MDTDWNRASFRAGGQDYGLLAEMQTQAIEDEGERERTKGGRDEGEAGAASFNGNPKIMPGDELYDVFHQTQVETLERQNAARASGVENDTPAPGGNSELTALMVAGAAMQGPEQQQGEKDAGLAAQEVTQPAQEAQQGATFHSLRAEQAEAAPSPSSEPRREEPEETGPYRPGPQPAGLSADYVTDAAWQKQEADHAQQQQRNRTMGLDL